MLQIIGEGDWLVYFENNIFFYRNMYIKGFWNVMVRILVEN